MHKRITQKSDAFAELEAALKSNKSRFNVEQKVNDSNESGGSLSERELEMLAPQSIGEKAR